MNVPTDPRRLLTRHPKNPILDPMDYPGVHALFNPAPVRLPSGKIGLLVSTIVYGLAEHSYRETRLAVSDDGIHFDLAAGLLIDPRALPLPVSKFGGAIDCRVTKIDDTFYILTPQGTREAGFSGCCTALYKTKDFEEVEFVDVVALPFNRGSSLFPEKSDGYYWRLDRPGEGATDGAIWISRSPDLVHWGGFRPLLAPAYAIWNTGKIGPTPPIRVPEGWLVLIHGVDAEACDGPHYCISAIMLDGENPSRILGKLKSPLLMAQTPYETNGHVDNVVFACGALADLSSDSIAVYYGAADTCIGLATGSLSAVVKACLNGD